MTVYIVFEGAYSDRCSLGVFSTREKAETYIAEAKITDDSEIEEHTVDEFDGAVIRDYWVTHLDPTTGEVRDATSWRGRKMASPTARGMVAPPEWNGPRCVSVYSFVSQDHARKLAVEEYQRRLREAATAAPKENA